MNTYWFEDLVTNEEFFVEANNRTEAIEIANKYFTKPKLYCRVCEEFAKNMGYDTY